jgi:hypothetical protein
MTENGPFMLLVVILLNYTVWGLPEDVDCCFVEYCCVKFPRGVAHVVVGF